MGQRPRPHREEGLTQYFEEISRYDLLTREQEIALSRRVRRGDQLARAALVNANLRLVVSIARRFVGRGASLMDLIEDGNVGLMKAADQFDPELGCRFATYATWWIKQSIRRALADDPRPVRIPSYLHPKIASWRKKAREIGEGEGREPSIGEVAQACGVDDHDLPIMKSALMTLRSNRKAISIDQQQDGDDTPMRGSLEDKQPRDPVAEASARADKNRLSELLGGMPKRSLEILNLRFGLDGGEPKTLREVGAAVHLSRERVRQIEAEALKVLAKMFEEGALPTG